jgi:hypothetical protein
MATRKQPFATKIVMPGGCSADVVWYPSSEEGSIEVPQDHRGWQDERTQDVLRHRATQATGGLVEQWVICQRVDR